MDKQEARREHLDRQRKVNEEHVRRRNAQIQAEVPGCVRTTGSRRQYHLSIGAGGEIVATEI